MSTDSAQQIADRGDKEINIHIVVNGTQEVVHENYMTYEKVVQLAFPGAQGDVLFSVTYAHQHGHDGTLAPGQMVLVVNGMSFNVIKTNRS